MARQLQHLSSLTALQQLSVTSENLACSDVSGLQHLSQLTQLGLDSSAFGFGFRSRRLSPSEVKNWACVAAVQSLALNGCRMRPEALTLFTQLRSLSLTDIQYWGDANLKVLLDAVGRLSLLTELTFEPSYSSPDVGQPPAAAFKAVTALTASTDL
jgi:hypothetical protein